MCSHPDCVLQTAPLSGWTLRPGPGAHGGEEPLMLFRQLEYFVAVRGAESEDVMRRGQHQEGS